MINILVFRFQIERLIAKNPQVLYPIRYGVKNQLGSAVDYAYYSYFAVNLKVFSFKTIIDYKNFVRILGYPNRRIIHYYLPIELFSNNEKNF